MFLRVKEWGPSLSSGISSQDLSFGLEEGTAVGKSLGAAGAVIAHWGL